MVTHGPFIVYGTASGVVWVGQMGGDQSEADTVAMRNASASHGEQFFVLAPVARAISRTVLEMEPVEPRRRTSQRMGSVVRLTSGKEAKRQD